MEEDRQNLQNEIQMLQQQKDELEFILESHRAKCKNNIIYDIRQCSPNSSPATLPGPPPQCTKYIKVENLEHENTPSPQPEVLRPNSLPVQSLEHQRPTSLSISNMERSRPTSLPVPSMEPSAPLPVVTMEPPMKIPPSRELLGVPLQTPSSCIPINFDSLMEGGTGLTPVGNGISPMISSSGTTPLQTPVSHQYNALPYGHQNNSDSCSTQQRSSSTGDLSSPDSVSSKLVSL